jgi:hypothetical protein
MNKYINILRVLGFSLSILFLTAFTSDNKTTNDWEIYKLKGKVKSMKEFSYKAITTISGAIIKDSIKTEYLATKDVYIIFNANGYKIEGRGFTKEGVEAYKWVYTYDENQKLIKGTLVHDNPEYLTTYSYIYNENGKLKQQDVKDYLGNLAYKDVYIYDEKGNIIELGRYDYTAEDYYEYDDYYDDYYEMEYIYEKYIYTYDPSGNAISESYYGNETSSKYLYSYNDKGKMTEHAYYDDDNTLIEIVKYAYDEKGNVIEEKYFKNGTTVDKIMTCTYEYDNRNNWTKCIIYENNIAIMIKERKIEYF